MCKNGLDSFMHKSWSWGLQAGVRGKKGVKGDLGKRKFLPAAIRSLSSLHNDCGTPVPWRMMPHETKHPFKNLFTKRPEQKNFQKSLKTNQPSNKPTNPLLPITVREEQQQHQRGQHNEVILNYDIGILTPPLQSVVVLIRVWRWWVPWTTNMTCKTNSPVKL